MRAHKGNGNPLFSPAGFVFDGSGNAYILEGECVTVQKWNSSYTYQSQFGGWGTGNGTFSSPYGIATDANGNFYVTSEVGKNVEVYNNSYAYSFQFGSAGNGNGQFNSSWGPAGVAIGR